MRTLITIITSLVFAASARADLAELADYLAQQNANRPSPFYTDPPPGLFAYSQGKTANSVAAKNDSLGWFAMQENARRDTMIQLMAPPRHDGYVRDPSWVLYMNQLGQQLNAPREVKRRYYGQ